MLLNKLRWQEIECSIQMNLLSGDSITQNVI